MRLPRMGLNLRGLGGGVAFWSSPWLCNGIDDVESRETAFYNGAKPTR